MDPKHFYNTQMPEKQGRDYEHARWHANPRVKAQYEMMCSLFDSHISVSSCKNILEIGPGPGTWTKVLHSQAPEAKFTLLDISREMLARAKDNLKDEASISFIEGDFIETDIHDSFDCVFSSRAIEYMEDKEALVSKLWKVTTPGGQVVLITKTPKPFLNMLRGRKLSGLHQGQITSRRLQSLLQAQGFVIEKVRVATATLPGLSIPFMNKLVFAITKHLPLVPILSESYVVVCRKPS
ncbi:MAG: class I SAM-dependent methyltransferase [Patescibacteria group bacterium UBA2103]